MSMNPLLNDALASLVLAAADEAGRLQAAAIAAPGAEAAEPFWTRARLWLALADQGAAALRGVYDAATLRRVS